MTATPEPISAETAQAVHVPGRPGRGIEKGFAKLTKRIRMLEQLVETLEDRCKLQEAVIQKLLSEREGKIHG